MTRYCRPMLAALITISAHVVTIVPAAATWDHAHGDSANTGFAQVDTAPAVSPLRSVELGTLAPGAGPVIGPSGMLYVGNMHGKVLAFQPDGTPAWTKLLPLGDPFLASPVVDAEGFVYVASSRKDQGRTKDGTFTHYEAGLLKLSGDTGDIAWIAPFPGIATGRAARITGGPVAAAPPSIWRSGSIEVVVIPVTYNYASGVELRLLAFAPQNGALLGNTVVSSKRLEVSGSWFDDLDLAQLTCAAVAIATEPAALPICGISYHEPYLGDYFATSWPMPGLAIAPDRAGSPLVIVSDWLNRDTVGYRFDSATGFSEAFRVHDAARAKTSTPTVVPDGHIVMGTGDSNNLNRGRVTFPGPATPHLADTPLAERRNWGWIAAAPTRMRDGKIVVIGIVGKMYVLQANANTLFGRFTLNGESIAAAAASCTHLYVASDGAFTTFDAKTLQQVAQFTWAGGGLSSPVIGPKGFVYGVSHAADNRDFLVVWPPPATRPPPGKVIATTCDPVVVRPPVVHQ